MKGQRTSRMGESQYRPNRKAFTVVEVLVVTLTGATLVAILLPALQQVSHRAKAIACQSSLRHCGLDFSMALDESTSELSPDAQSRLQRCVYDAVRNDLMFCPATPRSRARQDNRPRLGDKRTPWQLPCRDPLTGEPARPALGSYGLNGNGLSLLDARYARFWVGGGVQRSHVPVLLDCVSWSAEAEPNDAPPPYEGFVAIQGGITECCIDRHAGGINCLFLDWSVRKVGLKELWTLRWSFRYDARGPWTRAGGVRPEDWPQWMRRFEDF